jgi:hypothetical protein
MRSEAIAAASRKMAGAGIRMRSLTRFASTAATTAAAVISMISAKRSTSFIGRRA